MLNWYEPKWQHIKTFLVTVSQWISGAAPVPEKPDECTDEKDDIKPTDSVSQSSSRRSNRSSRSGVSSTSSACIRPEAERAALIIMAAALKFKHHLEDKEEELNQQKMELRKIRETLELQTEIARKKGQLNNNR